MVISGSHKSEVQNRCPHDWTRPHERMNLEFAWIYGLLGSILESYRQKAIIARPNVGRGGRDVCRLHGVALALLGKAPPLHCARAMESI
jgi:hypothetical protein